MSEYLHNRHFTLEEAREELTKVHALAVRMMELKDELERKGWDVYRHHYFGGRGPNGDGSFPEEMEMLVDILKGFEARGIMVKGMAEGLFDFPHIRKNGEEVYLCWQVGENDLEFWHTIDEGFQGRKRISEL